MVVLCITGIRVMKQLAETKKISYYEGPFLYIVRNGGDSTNPHNSSIVGVFTTPEDAREGIVIAREKIDDEVQKKNLRVRVVIPNTTMYLGCNTGDVEDLLRNPYLFEQKMRQKNVWENVIKRHNAGYHL